MNDKTEYRFRKNQPAVTGVFKNHQDLDKTLRQLREKNFSNEAISIMKAKSSELYEFPISKDLLVGAHIGAIVGLIQGALLLVLVSLNIIHLPWSETFIEIGPFLSAVAGGCLGINAGAIAGVFVSYIIVKVERSRIEHYLEKMGVVVSVHTNDSKEELIAKNVLVLNGAVKIFNADHDSEGFTFFGKSKVARPLPF